jgi:hypothetical protein
MKPIGASVEIEWLSGGTELAYVSLGEYDEETDEDTFGVPDDAIFGYFTIDELEQFKTKPFDGYKVLSYDLEYDDKDIEQALLINELEHNK